MIERCFETNIVSWNEQSRFSSELLVRHFSIKNINVITIYDYFSTFTDKSLLDYFILRFQFFCRKVCSLELRLWFFFVSINGLSNGEVRRSDFTLKFGHCFTIMTLRAWSILTSITLTPSKEVLFCRYFSWFQIKINQYYLNILSNCMRNECFRKKNKKNSIHSISMTQ